MDHPPPRRRDPLDDATVVAFDHAHVWHPYTAMDRWLSRTPPVLRRAEGVWLWTADGTRLFDASGSWWVSNLGHGHPAIRSALHAQLDQMAHVGFSDATHEPAARLAHELCAVAPPGLSRVFFSDNGSTAVEVALRAAFQFRQQNGQPRRRVFVSLDAAYHGDTIGTVAIGGIPVFHRVFGPLLFETIQAPSPALPPNEADPTTWHEVAFERLEAHLRRRADEVVAVVVEPLVQGAAGMRMYPAEWLRRLRALCDALDIFLIADEVFTGFGRTGTLFACEQAGITPDFLCLSKGLTGGFLPFAATLATERIFDGFRGSPDRTFFYGHSYCANPLGAAAALAVLDVFRTTDVLGNVGRRGAKLDAWMDRLADDRRIRHPRRTGLVAAFQLGDDHGYLATAGRELCDRLLPRGVLARPLGDTIYLVPSLLVHDHELSFLLSAIEDALPAP